MVSDAIRSRAGREHDAEAVGALLAAGQTDLILRAKTAEIYGAPEKRQGQAPTSAFTSIETVRSGLTQAGARGLQPAHGQLK